jgi:hypothetical protein
MFSRRMKREEGRGKFGSQIMLGKEFVFYLKCDWTPCKGFK